MTAILCDLGDEAVEDFSRLRSRERSHVTKTVNSLHAAVAIGDLTLYPIARRVENGDCSWCGGAFGLGSCYSSGKSRVHEVLCRLHVGRDASIS